MNENSSYMVSVNASNSIPYGNGLSVVYEGKMLNNQMIQSTDNIRIGDVPDYTWLPGTLGGGYIPCVPYEPPMPYDPVGVWPQTTIHTTGYFAVCDKWTVDLTSDDITMSCDMPGVKIDALKVEVKDGWLTATGVRHDLKNTGNQRISYQIHNQYEVSKYIPESATATLLDGVLTINMKKREELKPRVVTIKVSK